MSAAKGTLIIVMLFLAFGAAVHDSNTHQEEPENPPESNRNYKYQYDVYASQIDGNECSLSVDTEAQSYAVSFSNFGDKRYTTGHIQGSGDEVWDGVVGPTQATISANTVHTYNLFHKADSDECVIEKVAETDDDGTEYTTGEINIEPENFTFEKVRCEENLCDVSINTEADVYVLDGGVLSQSWGVQNISEEKLVETLEELRIYKNGSFGDVYYYTARVENYSGYDCDIVAAEDFNVLSESCLYSDGDTR